MVPTASSPASARARASSTSSRIQAILVAEKYGSSSKPVLPCSQASVSGLPLALASSAQRGAVRRSCQTMALWIGSPVARSHTTVVSRWLVMPQPARSAASTPAFSSAWRHTATVSAKMPAASCSTQPAWGYSCSNSVCAVARICPLRSNTMARLLVVPWSMARIASDMRVGSVCVRRMAGMHLTWCALGESSPTCRVQATVPARHARRDKTGTRPCASPFESHSPPWRCY